MEGLADGAIRFNSGDLIRVDLEVTERKTRSGKVKKPSYRILNVTDYKPLKIPRQETFAEYLEDSEVESGEGCEQIGPAHINGIVDELISGVSIV